MIHMGLFLFDVTLEMFKEMSLYSPQNHHKQNTVDLNGGFIFFYNRTLA